MRRVLIALANALLAAYKRRPDSARRRSGDQPETGEIKVWGLEARPRGQCHARVGRDARGLWSHRGADGQAGPDATDPRHPASPDVRRVRHREGDIVSGTVHETTTLHAARLGRWKPLPQSGAICLSATNTGRHQGVHRRSAKDQQGTADRGVTHAPAWSRNSSRSKCPRSRTASWRLRRWRASVTFEDREPPRPDDRSRGRVRRRRGSRVRNITNELRSERIDVVPYSDDPVEFIQSALAAARVPKCASMRSRASLR